MTIHKLDPLTDSRWVRFVENHPFACAFHSRGWMEALRKTYDYEPVVYTTTPPGEELTNGIPFCRVSSWLTGRRLVSVPFSDHCQPLVSDPLDFKRILSGIASGDARNSWGRFVELRPSLADYSPFQVWSENSPFGVAKQYFLHVLDLTPPIEELFRGFHKNCVQRCIKRAERENVMLEAGSSPEMLKKFYHLMMITRRRHRLPPQPIEWFRNMIDCMGDAVTIRVASANGIPVAAILTLSHFKTVIYKYGCSDERYFNLGGTFALFWQMIREAKEKGAAQLDMGRSDLDNPGLVQFKDRWGAVRSEISYFRSPPPTTSEDKKAIWPMAIANAIFARLPDPLLVLAGRALYRHKG